MKAKKIPCNKCGIFVAADKKAMWKHAMKYHPDMVLSKIGERVETNKEGSTGLFNIGYSFGKQLQVDNVSLLDVLKNFGKGLTR